MKIQIEGIPHSCQRYDTVGDWAIESDGTLVINVSEMSDNRSMMAVAVHELVEAILCTYKGITPKQVDDWDMNFKGEGEPGEAIGCPYQVQHIIANAIEHTVILHLGLTWKEHERNVINVSKDNEAIRKDL